MNARFIVFLFASFLHFNISYADPVLDPMPDPSTTASTAATTNAHEITANQIIRKLSQAHTVVHASGPSCPIPGTTKPSVADAKVCEAKYAKLYANPDIHVTFAFGYLDSRPDDRVDTGMDSEALVESMTTPCNRSELKSFCGFGRDVDDATKFSKTVIGPDHKPHQFEINIVSPVAIGSLVLDSEVRNTVAQKAQSAKARAAFQKALQTDDIVVYDGHARDGGGPDFSPPKLNPKTNHPDYPYYRANHPGLNDELTALANSKHRPKIIGMMACDSKLHFEKQLRKISPDSALLLTNMVTYTYVTSVAEQGMMDGLMSLRCDDGFVDSMEADAQPIVENQPEKGLAPPIDFEGWGVKTPNVVPAPSRQP
jgi:hypothetical protein